MPRNTTCARSGYLGRSRALTRGPAHDDELLARREKYGEAHQVRLDRVLIKAKLVEPHHRFALVLRLELSARRLERLELRHGRIAPAVAHEPIDLLELLAGGELEQLRVRLVFLDVGQLDLVQVDTEEQILR